MRLFFFIVISTILHFFLVRNLELLKPNVETGIPVRQTPVKIRILERTQTNAVSRKPPVQSNVQSNVQPKPRPTQQTSKPSLSANEAMKPPEYSDFLPSSAYDVVGEEERSGSGKRIADYGMPALQAADEIRLNLDIPLVFRKFHAEGSALAKIELRDPGLVLLYLDGDPHFRAVLYDLLQSKSQKFRELINALGRDDLRIRLVFAVKQQPEARVWDDTDIALENGTLNILRIRYVWKSMDGKLPQKGMPLPDEYAKRSEAYDKAHLQRLRDSPAFISPLRNREIP